MKTETTTIRKCPLCGNRLYPKKSGLVCKNFKCNLFWKMGGWTLKNSVWQYTDSVFDQDAAWDVRHGYPPRKAKIIERDITAMYQALCKNENLCFVIPLKYCSPDSEGAADNAQIWYKIKRGCQ